MILQIKLTIKFRALGITYGSTSRTWKFPVPEVALLFAKALENDVDYDKHGVKIEAAIVPGGEL